MIIMIETRIKYSKEALKILSRLDKMVLAWDYDFTKITDEEGHNV